MAVVLPIACAADDEYVPHCAALLHSLAQVHDPSRLVVHFLFDRDLDRRLLESLGAYAVELGLGWVPIEVGEDVRGLWFPDHHRFGQVGWYRVALAELLPAVDRILYLDSDVIVTDSLEPLLSIDLTRKVIGAVTNPLYPNTVAEVVGPLGLPSARDYFNSGVLLLDLDCWRRDGIGDRIDAFIEQGEGLDLWPDQTALNAVLWNRRAVIGPRWNAQNALFELRPSQLPYSKHDVLDARRRPAVVHFIGPYKPWHYRSKHPLRSLYFEHLSQTPWAGRRIEGATLLHRLLRLLPVPLGFRVERRVQAFRDRERHTG